MEIWTKFHIISLAKLDQANADLNQLTQEKESMQKTIESLRVDKNNLERNRVEINAMVSFIVCGSVD